MKKLADLGVEAQRLRDLIASFIREPTDDNKKQVEQSMDRLQAYNTELGA